ncbi:F390 synthetase-related protein [Hymenobacter ruricola]|uniref:Adenylate cyclase n=1 Tax=Hymenobacter ruricola TaxID=2791023 RepID=A0ABS0I3A6_9BACT|nr:F390 synthetase-related protein [Hymenobacter ruricola]MBF9221271.1 adenylate cyclase [Hymenobacter ruricola]
MASSWRAGLDRLLILWYYCRARYGRRPHSRAQLEQWQQRRLRRYARWVGRTFAFYRPWAEQPLSQWPVLEKSEYLTQFAGLNAHGLPLAGCLAVARAAEASRDAAASQLPQGLSVGLSSGTAGPQGVFLVSRRERLAWAGTVLAKALPGGLWRPARIALFLRANNPLYETLGGRHIRFAYFDLTRPLARLRQELAAFGPTVLVAPAYVLRLLAEAEAAAPLGLAPAHIYSAAEVLEDEDRAVIEQVFRQPVGQIYQAAEGFLGISCAHGRLHLNEDLLHVEREYLAGNTGRFMPIITDFNRSTQAIIRYRLNDVLIEAAEPCPCGSPCAALARVEGRGDDVFVLATPTGQSVPVFPDFIRSAVLQSSPHILDFRCVQTAPDAVTLQLSTPAAEAAEASKHATQALGALWARYGVQPPRLTLQEWTPPADENLTLKRRRVQRTFPVALRALLTPAAGEQLPGQPDAGGIASGLPPAGAGALS